MESSYHSIHARRPSMEVFQGVEFVALRVWCCNSYLHADENGRSVYHGNLRGGSGGGSLHNAVWAVEEVVAGVPPTRYVLLRGAYGRYLGSPDAPDREREGCCSLEAAQRDRDVLDVGAIMWRAVGCSGPDLARGCVVLLHDKSGRYLRGNQTFLARRPGVSVHSDVDNETSLRWEVVRVTPSQVRPELPIATECNLTKNLVAACFPPLRRQIQFVTAGAGAAGNIDVFTGKSVQLLREKLAGILGYDEFTLCVRAGIHGRLTPLLIDLPRSRETLHIVLVRPNSEAEDQLLFPNLNALLLLASVTSHISGSSSSDRGYAVSGSNGLRLPLITLRPNETAPQSSTPHNAYTLPLTDNGTAATAKVQSR
ncbi:hypothetical protein OsI_27942 [Oryza sativa Indica Group]|uniref:DUF569 domain-containing protein n=1 Tax=Oryza sativa subsp. indica TaxID=39946 RepID=B8BB71_ORYSI|nr:hypothetical protein OsI_27942 [Oryza sativa Indica Group]